MTTPKIAIYDASTNQVTTRDFDSLEVTQAEADKIKADKDAETLAKTEADKAATRAAVLTRLGLTTDELLAILS